MASTIMLRNIGGVDEKALQLNNSQFGRLINLPSTWSVIRVGVRVHCTDSGGNLLGTPRFALGFGAGVTNMVGVNTCQHFVGVVSGAPSWVRNATFYSMGTASWFGAKRVGATITQTASDIVASTTVGLWNQAAGAGTDRALFIVEITKGSPNYSFKCLVNIGAVATDFTREAFLNQLENNPPSATNHQWTAAPQTLAVDEGANGTLNAIQCWWDQADVSIELCDIAWAVIS
jgi:hypothetical protein